MSKRESASDPNSDPDRSAENDSPHDRWPLTPLVSATDVPTSLLPTIEIPEEQYHPLREYGLRRGRNAYGTFDNHELGILGEGAVARFFGTTQSVDTAVYERGDGGVDLEVHGVSIDVKTAGRRYSTPNLIVDAYQSLQADYYALVHRLGKMHFRLVGYAPRQFVANASTEEYQGCPCHVVPQRDLFPFPPTLR